MANHLSFNHEKELKSILVARSRDGATVDEIRHDFLDLCGELPTLFQQEFSVIRNGLQAVEGVYYAIDNNHCYLWYCKSESTRHISKMVKQQKPPRNTAYGKSTMRRKPYYRSTNSCFFKDNNIYNRARRPYVSEPSSMGSKTTSSSSLDSMHLYRNNRCPSHFSKDHPAYFYEYQLIGDDFLLALATAELPCSANRNSSNILQSGLCISGQTIHDATKRVSSLLTQVDQNVIVNLGSVDLLHGCEYVDMKTDFLNLYEAFRVRGVTPIVTTLAPLANQKHNPEVEKKWRRFNDFLRNTFPRVVDITPVFVAQPTGHTIHDCYQRAAIYITGSCQPHALWSRVGRQRVLNYLKREVFEQFEPVGY